MQKSSALRFGTEQPYPPRRNNISTSIKERSFVPYPVSRSYDDYDARQRSRPMDPMFKEPLPPSPRAGGYPNYKDSKPIPAAGNDSRPSSAAEELLLQTCAYELKGMACPVKGGCNKKKICLVRHWFSLSPNAPLSTNASEYPTKYVAQYTRAGLEHTYPLLLGALEGTT